MQAGRRKLIQVALDWTRPKDPPISLGHASIWANLVQHNISVFTQSWAVNHEHFKPSEVIDFAFKHAQPDTDFAVGAFVWNERYLQQIFKQLRAEKFPGRLIIGGPQVSYVKDNAALEQYYSEGDIFIRGYAEGAMLKLMQSSQSMPIIKGVHYRGVPDLGGSAVADLESLFSPFLTGLIKPQRFIRWETQRGCPFKCSFCQHREHEKDALTRRYLDRSRIAAEIVWINENPVIQDIAVLDPTFNSGPYYKETIALLRKGGYSGKISLQCRADMVNPEFMAEIEQLSAQANVVLEFGLQTIHKEEQRFIDRATNIRKVTRVIQECIAKGISIEVSLIFGLPGQTFDSFRQSVDYCIGLGIPIIHAFPLMLLRGTPLFDNKQALGLIESNEVIASPAIDRLQRDIPHVIASPSFTAEDWRKMADLAEWLELKYNQPAPAKINSFVFQPSLHGSGPAPGMPATFVPESTV